MYRACHKYSPERGNTSALSINEGDTLYIVEKTNETWWLASNGIGKVGYVPKSYIKKDESNKTDIILQSIERAIEDVYAGVSGTGITRDQQKLLMKLNSHKKAVLDKNRSGSSKRRAPLPPASDEASTANVDSQKHRQAAPPPPPRRNELANENSNKTNEQTASLAIPQDIGYKLLNQVEEMSNLSTNASSSLIISILSTISSEIATLQTPMKAIQEQIQELIIDETHVEPEGETLGLALANIEEIKDDAQQRNWAIANDEDFIANILNEILNEISSLEQNISSKTLSLDDCRGVRTLVEYHQMESRLSLRLITLQIFGAIASLSTNFLSAMLSTILPLELARDIKDNIQDEQRVCYSSLVLSMLFSSGEQPPFAVYEQVNEGFIEYILSVIEGYNCTEQMMEMLVNVILSFNLHFIEPSENKVMHCIAKRTTCTAFSEKLMMLINRGDDPVTIPEHWQDGGADANMIQPQHSVLKFFQDIYSQSSTAHFLYTNDMKVLLEIIARNISDLSSGNKLRTDFLDLLLDILTQTDYAETRHKSNEFKQCLNRILNEENPENSDEKQILDFDKKIVERIFNDFGSLF